MVVFVVGLHAQDLTSDPSGTDPTSNPNASDPMSYPSATDSTPVFNEETLGPYAPYMKAFEEIQTFKVKITESFYANFAKFTTACNSLATTYRLFGVIMDNLLKNSVAKKIGGTAVLQKRIRADVARVNPSIIWNEIQIIKDQLLIQIRDDCTNNFLQNLTSVITDFPKAAPCVTASLPAIHSALTILASEADMKIREEEATLEGQVNAVKSKISSFGNAFAYQLKRACNTNVKCVVPYVKLSDFS